jgi:ribosomal-protein-alanine N-acetyltransferase
METRREIEELFAALPVLRSGRLRLAPLELAHADDLFRVFSDPTVVLHTNDAQHASVDDTRQRIQGMLERHVQLVGMSWALFVDTEEQAVGHCSLHSISWTNRRADLGFDLASSHWRHGIMTEALRRIISFSFVELRLNKLSAQATCDNEPCRALLRKLGFNQEGLLRQHGFWKGQAHDLMAFGLVAGDSQHSTS